MTSTNELTFAVFVMHVLAAAWGMTPAEAYAICKRSGALDSYIIPCYDVLHTLGANALIEDLTGYVRERGVAV